MGKSKKKKLKNDECRVIRINEDAVYELLRENMIDNGEEYFGSPNSKFHYHWMRDNKTGDFVCFVSKKFINDYGFDLVMEKVSNPTTESLYKPSRYVSIFWNEEEKKKVFSTFDEK